MANRAFRSDKRTFEQGLVQAAGKVTLSPSALTGTLANTIPYCSASMTAAGCYRIQFDDSYVALRSVTLQLENTGSQDLSLVGSGSTTGVGVNSTSAMQYNFFLRSGSNNTIPGNQVAVYLNFLLKNSGV